MKNIYKKHVYKTNSRAINCYEKVGFKEIEVYSDFNVYNEECERNIFVCKKG